MPNKLAELVKLLALPTPLSHTHMHTDSPHSSLCTHLIHNWHGSSLRPGEQCKAKQRNDSNKVGPHFGTIFFFLIYFTLYALILLVSSSSDAILLYLYFFKFIVVFFLLLFISVNFLRHALWISCLLNHALLLSSSALLLLLLVFCASAVVVCTKYNGEVLNV